MAAAQRPDAIQHLPSVAAALAADPAAIDDLVEDAVVWASQHGLVRHAGATAYWGKLSRSLLPASSTRIAPFLQHSFLVFTIPATTCP
jgi:hypothetical protein